MIITAKYAGTCPDCGGRWQEGDRIRVAEGAWRHETCPDDPGEFDLKRGESVCTACWLIHPAGACDR